MQTSIIRVAYHAEWAELVGSLAHDCGVCHRGPGDEQI